jgi:hypothetical protein
MEMQNGTAILGNRLAISYKALLLYDPIILNIYSRETTYIHTKICMGIFVATLSVFSPRWKQAKCPSIGKKTKNQNTTLVHLCNGMAIRKTNH